MRRILLAFPIALAACGGSTSGLDPAEIQSFNTNAQAVSSAAATYETQAATMTSATTCAADQNAYDSQVRPLVGQMQGMGASMDAMMGSMNHLNAEDMGCAANAMMAELDRHRTAACASTTDMTPNKAEAQQHVATMTQWASHEMGRSHDLASMVGMGMGTMGSGTTNGHCVHNADGSYTFQP
jgi:hypothetical protein